MESQTFLAKNIMQLQETLKEYLMMKKPIKATNFIFARSWSLKVQKDDKNLKVRSNENEEQTLSEKNFVPKLKSKQLLREPKFFFSVQRKKQKNESYEPFFQQVKCNNPEMRGSKTKTFCTQMFSSRKKSFKQIDRITINKTPQVSRKNSNGQLLSHSSQSVIEKKESECQLLARNSSFTSQKQAAPSIKPLKRPKLNENISFLIRKKRQMKAKTTSYKIRDSKQKMHTFSPNFDPNNQ